MNEEKQQTHNKLSWIFEIYFIVEQGFKDLLIGDLVRFNPLTRKDHQLRSKQDMGVVKTSSANIATLYLTSLAFIVLCVYNFSSPVTFLVNNTNYGAALLVLSVFLVITGTWYSYNILIDYTLYKCQIDETKLLLHCMSLVHKCQSIPTIDYGYDQVRYPFSSIIEINFQFGRTMLFKVWNDSAI